MALAVPKAIQYLLGPDVAWRDVFGALLDGGVVSYLVYRVLLLIRGTRAINVLLGLFLLGIAYLASQWANLVTLNWLLGHFLSVSFIFGVIVLFQADIRRGLARLGRSRLLASLVTDERREQAGTIEALAQATSELSRRRWGALIAVERLGDLGEVLENGLRVDAAVSAELLVSMFQPGGPLHDGAIVVQRGRVAAARCLLPLATSLHAPDLGTRHRAALGLAEEVDAAVLVVSEERGDVSLAVNGKLRRRLREDEVRELLTSLLAPDSPRRSGLLARLGRIHRGPAPRPEPAGRRADGGAEQRAEEDRATV